jgi:hypothetical protein
MYTFFYHLQARFISWNASLYNMLLCGHAVVQLFCSSTSRTCYVWLCVRCNNNRRSVHTSVFACWSLTGPALLQEIQSTNHWTKLVFKYEIKRRPNSKHKMLFPRIISYLTSILIIIEFSSKCLCFVSCRGTSGIDIDLRRVDIDQCPLPPGSTQLNIFAASDKCKKDTTQVRKYYEIQAIWHGTCAGVPRLRKEFLQRRNQRPWRPSVSAY